MDQFKQIYILLLLFILSVAGLRSIEKGPHTRVARIIEKFMDTYYIPGLSITVGKNGQVAWTKGFGFANINEKIPVTSKTRFRIGSISKTVTSAAVGRLVDQDKLDLDAPIQTYVPTFPEKRWPITTRMAMSHLSGIRHYKGNEFLNKKYYSTVLKGLKIFQDDTLIHEPGTHYLYSSYAWNLVSAVVEGATGIDYLSYMEDTVFTALDTETLIAEHQDSILIPIASFYNTENGKLILAPQINNSYKWASGGLVGTTTDLVNFIHNLYATDFLSQEVMKELHRPNTTRIGQSINYGLGWQHYRDYWRNPFIGHSGGSVGCRAMLIYDPQKEIVVAILVNSSSEEDGNLNLLAQRIARRFIH